MYLGIDVSKSIAGFCVIGENGDIKNIKSLVFKKKDDTWKKLIDFVYFFEDVWLDNKIEKIAVEAPKKQFRMGNTNSNTMVDLIEFNVLCRYEILKKTGIEPELVNESAARKSLGVTIKNKIKDSSGKKISSKQQTFNQVRLMKDFEGKVWDIKRTGSVKDYHYDEVDAYVIAKYLFYRNGKATK